MLKGRKHFAQSVKPTVSVAISKLGKTNHVFVQPCAKINSVYYCENVLEQGWLPAIRRISNNDLVFKHDGAPCTPFTTLSLTCMRSNVPEFIEPENWPPNSPDLNPPFFQCGQRCRRRCIVTKFQTLISSSKFWSTPGLSEARTHWTERLISCVKDWQWLSRH